MPFIQHTPEALLPRSDSKNPNATCRGLTSSGRPCRRAIAGSPGSSKSRRGSSTPGSQGGSLESFCWQHKEQASFPATTTPQGLQNSTIRERTSLDTLVDRLGLLEVEDQRTPSKPPRHRPGRTDNQANPSLLRPTEQQVYPLRVNPRPKPKPKPKSNIGLFCCIGEVDDSALAPRPARKPREKPPTHTPSPKLPPRMPQRNDRLSPSPSPSRHQPSRPSPHYDPSSRTTEFLSMIPKSTTPETTSLLLAELAKPVSEFDEEGYIYIFWLTSTTMPAAPPSDAVSSLLSVPGRPGPGRSTSDVLKTYSANPSSKTTDKTILLKIGRASNVQRRLNEWSRQCGYNLSLIRYYPYHSSSPGTEEPPRTPRKVPHAHKVERLIHIELQGQRAQGSGRCGACGREHREWFEVEAKREGVKIVDEVVRRWVDWGMSGGADR